ncbi:MAG: aldo/keto reductase [Eubacterium sp.]|nr:aldo/keto reductase [Eubacterium sp.]
MQYRKDRHGNDISVLGYGCMRFTKNGGSIDLPKANREIMTAYKLGVNYFDTAYIYPGSEAALGQILEKNKIREKVNIATKLPQYLIASRKAIDKIFEEELSRLRTTYVDYYLMHHLTDVAMWEKLKSIGILDWIAEKKKSGQIRNIGFSYHGNTENFLKILNDYDWDFCQIQYNYLDDVSQAGEKGLLAAQEKGIPVVIMEPLRGGKLVNMLPESAKRLIEKYGNGQTPAELAFRWLYDQPGVTCVLSGMNSVEMVKENCRVATATPAGSFSNRDRKIVEKVKQLIRRNEKVGCTGCRYCMPCPKGVDIPGNFRCWNQMYIEGKNAGRMEFAQTVALSKEPPFADQCIECGKCEMHCPQGIKIREKLKEADRDLRPWYFKTGLKAARWYMLRKGKNS